jgi:hypothetical protein
MQTVASSSASPREGAAALGGEDGGGGFAFLGRAMGEGGERDEPKKAREERPRAWLAVSVRRRWQCTTASGGAFVRTDCLIGVNLKARRRDHACLVINLNILHLFAVKKVVCGMLEKRGDTESKNFTNSDAIRELCHFHVS